MRHFLVAAALLAQFDLAAAHDTAPPDASSARNDAATPVAGAGLRIYRDPETGQWLDAPPTDADGQTRMPQIDMPRPDYGRMTVEMLPDGSTVLHTNGQIRMATMVRRKPDGSFEEYCAPVAAPAERKAESEPEQ
jgi:hypothetical protein